MWEKEGFYLLGHSLWIGENSLDAKELSVDCTDSKISADKKFLSAEYDLQGRRFVLLKHLLPLD